MSPRIRKLPLLTLLLVAGGCSSSKTLPPITPLSGIVLLDDQPLPFADVVFVPELEHFGAEVNSVGTTDQDGKFTLVCHKDQQPGAVVGWHRVLVTEMAPPAELRGQDAESQRKLAEFFGKLKNRPIPESYGAVGTTSLRIEVTADQSICTLRLTRTK